MSVTAEHVEYGKYRQRWFKMRALMEGQDEVKRLRTTFLPMPNPTDKSDDNETRYSQYLERAVYTNIVARTREGLVGAVFRKDPNHDLPDAIQYLINDTDGGGLSMDQLGKRVCGELMEVGRAGLLADFPEAEPGMSAEQVGALGLRSTIAMYKAEDIINWRAVRQGGNLVTTLVVLRESVDEITSEFQSEDVDQYRVLIMQPEMNQEGEPTGRAYYEQRLYNDGGQEIIERYNPRKADSSRWKEIPFVFVGSENNNPDVDRIPLYDLAMVNVGHYRNSADYEEGVFIAGQPTLNVDPGADTTIEQWQQFNPDGVQFGSRAGILTPGGSATLLQAQANSTAFEAMGHKETLMIKMGAKLVTEQPGNRTAEEARINASGDSSVLSNLTGNASEALAKALYYCAQFEIGPNVPEEEIVYELNQEFFDETIDPQQVMALIQLADRGDLAQSDVRSRLRRVGWVGAGRTDEDIDEDVSQQGIGAL